jgi:hypothetical protein
MTTAAVVLAAVATLHPRMPREQARAIAHGIAGEPSCMRLDPLLVVAVADVESSLEPGKVNARTGAAGLLGVLSRLHPGDVLTNLAVNLRIGCAELVRRFARFRSADAALSTYSGRRARPTAYSARVLATWRRLVVCCAARAS